MQFGGPRNRGQSTRAQQSVCTDEIGVRCEGFVSQFGPKASEQPHVCEQNGGGTAKMTVSLSQHFPKSWSFLQLLTCV